MKLVYYVVTFSIACIILLTGCSIGMPTSETPFEEPVTADTATETPMATPVYTETSLPTAPPLATYTPTPEPTAIPSATPTQPPIVDLSGPFSIENITELKTTSLAAQENIRDIAWLNAPEPSIGYYFDGTLSIFDSNSSEPLLEIAVPEEYYVFDVSPIGNLIACTDDYERILILSATTLEQVAVVNPETYVANVHFDLSGTKMLITSMDVITAIEADALTGEILKSHSGFSTAAPVYDAVFDRYTDNIIWYARGRMQLQNPINDRLSSDFAHEEWINAFAISPDGEHLAVATAKTLEDDFSPGIQLWHTSTGMALDFLKTDNMPADLFYTVDGSLLIGTDGPKLKFWNATTGELIQETASHVEAIYKASLAPEGDAILTVSNDGQVVLWSLP